MKLFATLFTENPMMIEITRFRRKFLGGGNALNGVILAMCGLIYLGLLALVWNYREAAHPIAIIFLQTALFTLLAPALLHGAIAGERERRSWDFLLVAPITHAQIVCGKFMGAAVAILVCAAFLCIPMLIGVVFYENYSYSYTGASTRSGIDFFKMLQAELLSISWGFVVCAMTIFFSARCKRAFITLGTVLAILVGSLIVWPILTVSATMGSPDSLLNFFHPFWTIAQMEVASRPYREDLVPAGIYGFPQIFTYVAMTIVFLAWTERTLRFADAEVKFLPKHKDA